MTELERRIERLEQMQHRVMRMLEELTHPNEGKLYNVEDAAKMLSVSKGTLREWMRNGKVKAVKFGKSWKVSDTELRRLINNQE